jgi:hypothetical protein
VCATTAVEAFTNRTNAIQASSSLATAFRHLVSILKDILSRNNFTDTAASPAGGEATNATEVTAGEIETKQTTAQRVKAAIVDLLRKLAKTIAEYGMVAVNAFLAIINVIRLLNSLRKNFGDAVDRLGSLISNASRVPGSMLSFVASAIQLSKRQSRILKIIVNSVKVAAAVATVACAVGLCIATFGVASPAILPVAIFAVATLISSISGLLKAILDASGFKTASKFAGMLDNLLSVIASIGMAAAPFTLGTSLVPLLISVVCSAGFAGMSLRCTIRDGLDFVGGIIEYAKNRSEQSIIANAKKKEIEMTEFKRDEYGDDKEYAKDIHDNLNWPSDYDAGIIPQTDKDLPIADDAEKGLVLYT